MVCVDAAVCIHACCSAAHCARSRPRPHISPGADRAPCQDALRKAWQHDGHERERSWGKLARLGWYARRCILAASAPA